MSDASLNEIIRQELLAVLSKSVGVQLRDGKVGMSVSRVARDCCESDNKSDSCVSRNKEPRPRVTQEGYLVKYSLIRKQMFCRIKQLFLTYENSRRRRASRMFLNRVSMTKLNQRSTKEKPLTRLRKRNFL